ncbi:MAG: hypothetical protein HY966_02405 [Ignavibacteriales bacterium]|nr:hypothetical protein [Ignavibacteriales bacterium]
MQPNKNWMTLVLTMIVGLSMATTSYGMPNFARRYNMSCASCHNGIPRLNEFGFQFRAAGFRLPDEIGKGESSTNAGDYIAARTQTRFDYKTSDVPTASGTTSSSNTQLTFHEVTFYPITGAFGKNYASLVEMSFLPDEPAEIENAYVRANYGDGNKFWSVRAGIFHPFEGYGASDRPLGLSRPLIQSAAANNGQSTLFKPWGFDQAGLEVGYTMDKTSFRATVFNGLIAPNSTTAEPAQGGSLSKSSTQPSRDNKDVQLTATHMLTDDGGGVTGYAYLGNVDLPVAGSLVKNSFQRYALYGSYPVQKFLFLGGYQTGADNLGTSFNSNGYFGEVNYNLSEPMWVGVRYDGFDPSTSTGQNEVSALTAVANFYADSGLQFIGEFQNKATKKGTLGTQTDNSVQVRMIFIF